MDKLKHLKKYIETEEVFPVSKAVFKAPQRCPANTKEFKLIQKDIILKSIKNF